MRKLLEDTFYFDDEPTRFENSTKQTINTIGQWVNTQIEICTDFPMCLLEDSFFFYEKKNK